MTSRLRRILFGDQTRCALPECRVEIVGDGFRANGVQVFCSEAHAAEDQQMPAM